MEAWPLKLSYRTIYDLEDHLLLFFTGYTRSAGEILKDQDVKSKKQDSSMIANCTSSSSLAARSRPAGGRRPGPKFGELMDTHWEYRKSVRRR